MASVYPKTTHLIAAYLRRRLPHIKGWSGQGTLAWVQWFLNKGRCVIITDKGKLVGVTMVRLVDEPEQANEEYKDTGGPVAYIEACAAKSGLLMPMFELFHRTYPNIKKMAWVRSKYQNRPITVPINRARHRFSTIA